jgi:hypothetical protein
MGTPTLAVADLVDFQVHLVGDIEPVFWAEYDSLVDASPSERSSRTSGR